MVCDCIRHTRVDGVALKDDPVVRDTIGLAEQMRASVVVEITWPAADRTNAHVHVHFAQRPGWLDRDLAFAALGMVGSADQHTGQTPERLAGLLNSIPLKRMGRAEEVAQAIMWLLSDEASYTTGSILSVHGGR